MTEVRTRFAPSPTGLMHVGGMRTAFVAWLLAKHHGGKFLLRIEDTDQERLVPGAVRFIIEELQWFGIVPDEAPSRAELKEIGEDWDGAPDLGGPCGPYIQSHRGPRYREVAEMLVASGAAYRCDCTAEMLAEDRARQQERKESPGYSGRCRDRNVAADKPHVVRLKIPHDASMSFDDGIKGKITWDSISLRDTVLLKSDGLPLYHLAVVVDDHDMGITQVLRGEEWLASTPIHLLVYKALGWTPPSIAHLPVVMGTDGKKLSKRRGAPASNLLREQGYLADAILNYLTLIGWNPGEGTEQEVFSRQELIEKFTLDRCNSANGVFDPAKLLWMNGLYIRRLSVEQFTDAVKPFIEKAGLKFDEARWRPLVAHVQERAKTLVEVPPMVDYLFTDKIAREMKEMFQKGVDAPKAKEILLRSESRLVALEDFSHTALEAALRPIAEELGLKVGPMLGVVRIAVTGKKVSPPLFESMSALGKEVTLVRVREALGELG